RRRPEVLLVGQAVQPRPQVVLPVPVELLGQFLAPVDVHGSQRRSYCGQFWSSISGILRFVLETSARLLRLLGLLQVRPEWSGADLAERLGVTVRTLRRDVQRLRDLDYPVHSVPGVAGGYRLGSGRALPPLLLDDDEATAVVVSLRSAASHTVAGLSEASVSALAKLDQVLPARLRERTAAIQQATVALTGPGPVVDPEQLAALAA